MCNNNMENFIATKLNDYKRLGQFVTDVQNEVAHVIEATFPACEGR